MKLKYLFTITLLFCTLAASAEKRIAPDDRNVIVEGAIHKSCRDGRMTINRFSDEFWHRDGLNNFAPKKAATQSGVRVVFKTDSRIVKPLFSAREDADLRQVTNFYGVFKNGAFVGNLPGNALVLESDGGVTEWEIVLPIFYGVDFDGLIIDDNSKMFKVKRPARPVYVAIGDSITHGAGQEKCGSNMSYAFTVASENGYDLYNLAVGGSQISPAVAGEIEGIDVDIITVLWGYNDWNALKGDVEVIAERYAALLAELRRYQPQARIYCIMPTTSANESGMEGKKAPGRPLGDVRDAERKVVNDAIAAGDKNLHIIEGSEISAVEDLKGVVHFNNDGAVRFGKALAKLIK